MFRALLVALISSSVMFCSPAAWSTSGTPDAVITAVTDKLRAELGKTEAGQTVNPETVFVLIERHVAPVVDFERIARRVLGKDWEAASAAQRTRFVTELRKMMFRTYSHAVGGLAGATLRYGDVRRSRSGNVAMVPTRVLTDDAPEVKMNYYLYRGDQGWRLYDISVAGVSMLKTYKRTFKNQVRELGIDGLIDHLASVNLSKDA
ncbi:MAG: ABC transporter substrate-binding protein [Pseudomonadota bacterium]